MGVHWKIQFLRGVTKHQYRKGEIAQKRGTGLRGGLGKGHGGCFWQGGGGVETPNTHYVNPNTNPLVNYAEQKCWLIW